MRTLVIGGTGLISGGIARELKRKGHAVTVFHRGHRPLEMNLSFSATLSAFPPGDYLLRFTVHDKAFGKQVSFDVPITITAK